MSLAQKIDRPPLGSLEAPSSPPIPKVSSPIDFRQLGRRPALATSQTPAPLAAAVAPLSDRPPQSNIALDLLTEVSIALPALMTRCQSLDEALATTKQQARTEVEAVSDLAREWQQVAQSLKAQVEQLEKETAKLRQRAEVAEQENLAVKNVAEKSQQAAAEAECLSSLFQEKVIASFGIGSAGHAILESVRNRTHQMITA